MPSTQTTEARDVFVTGLRNAHAMEKQALAIMEPQVKRIEHYPEIKAQLERHVRETEGQAQRLEKILESLDESPSLLKDATLSVAGGMAAMGHTPAPDEILKNSFANFAFENYEIAAYNSLIVLAEKAGQSDFVPVLEKNLEEEQRMAQWLEENLEPVTERYVALRQSGETAKH